MLFFFINKVTITHNIDLTDTGSNPNTSGERKCCLHRSIRGESINQNLKPGQIDKSEIPNHRAIPMFSYNNAIIYVYTSICYIW